MSTVSQPEDSHLRLFDVTDEALAHAKHILTPEEFAIEGIPDEDWEAFYAALAEA
ncbi:MAG: hypothetical protein ACRDV4_00950 [Acidimicrobiales bacterium]